MIYWPFFKILQILKKFRPDILHTNSSKAGIIGRLAGHYMGISKTYHSPHGHIFYGYYNTFISKIFILLERFAAHYCNKILNLTEVGKNDHIRVKIASPDKTVVSSCGVDLTPFRKKATIVKKKSDNFTVCWIGRIVPIKNLKLLLDAVALLQQDNVFLKYKIIGDGELLTSMKQYADHLKLKNVNFAGYKEKVDTELISSDIFVLTSLNEGFGRVIIEAMAAGLPIIATKVGGVPEIVKDRENAILIPSGSPAALADSIRYISENREFCYTISQNNQKKIESYSIEYYILKVIAIYEMS